MNRAGPSLPLPKKARRHSCLLLCLLAAVTAAASVFSAPLQAQEGAEYEYVDLIMIYEYSDSIDVEYSVRNAGTQTANGVAVSFLLEDLETSAFVSSSSITTTEEGTTQRFTWQVGTLSPGETSQKLTFNTFGHSGLTRDPGDLNLIGVITATASSLQPEPDLLSANNVAKFYSYTAGGGHTSRHMRNNRLALLLSVDDLRPDAGGDVDFGLTAHQLASGNSQVYNTVGDIDIRVELSRGLEFKSTTDWTRPDAFTTTGRSATWTPGAVDVYGADNTRPSKRDIAIEAKLTSDSLDDIPLEERCITARVEDSIPPPNPDYVLSRLTQCLGDDPPVLLNSGKVELMAVYSCVDADPVVYPCRSDSQGAVASDLELLVRVKPANIPELRSSGLGRIDEGTTKDGYRVALRPEKVVIQVKDPEGRKNHSSGVRWQTYSDNFTNGVDIDEAYIAKSTTTWTDNKVRDKISAVGINGNKPGTVSLKDSSDNEEYANADWDFPTDTDSWYSFSDLVRLYYEMSTLGTYVTTRSFRAERSGLSDPYTASGTFHIHVGPIAELEVRDGGPGYPPSGSRAYTMVAVNNGPDTAPAARVTLTGLPRSPRPDFTATKGTLAFDATADDGNGAWVWTIGELAVTDVTRGRSGREGEILTIAAGSSREITASIENTKDYEVCIDSSGNDVNAATEALCKPTGSTNTWHTTDYYDYDDRNDTAAIAARAGAGSALRTAQATAGISLSWPARSGATAYGIEVSEDGGATWKLLQSRVRGASYTHMGIPMGATRHYQVHAVDREANRSLPFARASAVAGRVSQETAPAGAPEKMALSATAASREGIQLTWVKPADYGSAITGYMLQAANGRNGPWTNVDPQPYYYHLAYDYGGLEPNTRKYFRIRATNDFGSGLWSPVVEGRTLAAGVPGEPQYVGAGPYGDNAVGVYWQPAEDNGSPITQYEAQWSEDGSTGWRRVGSAGAGSTSLNHTGLTAGQTYYYQVRARNSAGWGPWSQPPASAVATGVQPPGAIHPRTERNGSTAMDIFWESPQEDGGGDITGYQIEWSPTGEEGTFRSLASPAATARSYTHTGLTPGNAYYYRMRARNSSGWGPWSETAWDNTERDVVPDAPTLTATANGSAEINLSWTRPDGNGASITRYELEYYDDEYQGWFWLVRGGPSWETTHYTDRGLEPGTERQYRIRAYNDNGAGQWSAVRTVRTDSSKLTAPKDLETKADDEPNSEKRIVLNWEALDGASSYRIERSRWQDGPWERLSNGNRSTTYTDSRDLYAGMTRYYRVAATGSGGTGVWSEAVAGHHRCSGADEAGAAAGCSDAAALHQRGPGLGVAGLGAVGQRRRRADYRLRVPGGSYRQETFTTTGTTGTIRGLDDGHGFYYFEVRAVNAVGEGEWSDSIYTHLWPDRSEQVRVSTTNITVTEGGTFTFTVSLNRQPPLPMGLGVYPRGLRSRRSPVRRLTQYLDKVLIPNGWTHPDE